MSQDNIINKYINSLATTQHALYVSQDEAETLKSTVAEQETIISDLRTQLADAKAATPAPVVADAPKQDSPAKAEAPVAPTPGSSK